MEGAVQQASGLPSGQAAGPYVFVLCLSHEIQLRQRKDATMRLRIGSGFGIPIYLHWTFFLLPLWILWSRPDASHVELAFVFTVLPLVFGCVVLHEFGHIMMARRFGIGTQDVTLYPIGGVARLKKMSDRPLEELLIAVAGPAVNVLITLILLGALAVALVVDSGLVFQIFQGKTFAGNVLLGLLGVNVLMVLFNLLPAFPMDGGRVLRALLTWGLGFYRATQIAVYVGIGMALLIGFAGIMTENYMPAVIGLFVILAGQQELLAVRIRERFLRRRAEEEPLTVYPAAAQWPGEIVHKYTWDNRTGTWRKEPGTLT
jgi:Zn-dependent protease